MPFQTPPFLLYSEKLPKFPYKSSVICRYNQGRMKRKRVIWLKQNYKNYRLLAAIVLATSTVVIVAPSTSEASMFKDVSSSEDYYQDLLYLVNEGFISIYADKSFKPEAAVTRGQFAQMLVKILGIDTENAYNPYLEDVPVTHQFYREIAVLYNLGIDVVDKKNMYRPQAHLTRYEAAHILQQVLQLDSKTSKLTFIDVKKAYAPAVKAVVGQKLMTGKTTTKFEGEQALSRRDVVHVLTNIKALQQQEETIQIERIQSKKVYTAQDEVYTVSEQLEELFAARNGLVLKGATVKAVVVNGQIKKITRITLQYSGTAASSIMLDADGVAIDGDVFVKADYVTLKDLKINGDVVIEKEAATNLSLEKVTIKNNVVVESGYYDDFTLQLKNATLKQLLMHRDEVVVKTNREIPSVAVAEGVMDFTIDGKIKKLVVDNKAVCNLMGIATIQSLHINKGSDAKLYVNGTLKLIAIEHSATNVYLNPNLKIALITIPRGTSPAAVIPNLSTTSQTVEKIVIKGTTKNLLVENLQ